MKTYPAMALILLTLFAVSGTGPSAYAADTAAAAPANAQIKQQIQTLRNDAKVKNAADREALKKQQEQLRSIRESYKTQLTDLKKQREEAAKVNNKEQFRALQKQISALKRERRDKMNSVRSELKGQRKSIHSDKKALRKQVKQLRSEKKK